MIESITTPDKLHSESILHQAVLGNVYFTARKHAAGMSILPGPLAIKPSGELFYVDVLGVAGGIDGIPDFAALVISKDSYKEDLSKKRLCLAANVPELWLLDLQNEIITICIHNGRSYDEDVCGPGERFISPILGGAEINVSELFSVEVHSVNVSVKSKAEKASPPQDINVPRNIGKHLITQYTAEDVKLYRERDPEVARLFAVAEQTTGTLLSHADQSMYLGFYDDLGLKVDVIQVLLQYCIDKQHTQKNYIKAVAQDWANRGIDSIEEAEQYIENFESSYKKILNTFGIRRTSPAPIQIEYMNRWLNEYKLPLEIIQIACEKTILAIAEPKFEYTEAIIKKWHENNIKTEDEIEALEDAFYENLKMERRKKSKKGDSEKIQISPQRRSKIYNYQGREWDYNKLDKLEQVYLKQSVNERS